jgi:hypothetical protein
MDTILSVLCPKALAIARLRIARKPSLVNALAVAEAMTNQTVNLGVEPRWLKAGSLRLDSPVARDTGGADLLLRGSRCEVSASAALQNAILRDQVARGEGARVPIFFVAGSKVYF